jgi:hypothetical protein
MPSSVTHVTALIPRAPRLAYVNERAGAGPNVLDRLLRSFWTTHLRGIPAAIHRLSELPDWQSRAFRPFVKRNVEEKRWDISVTAK